MADRKLSITITGDAKQAKAALRDLEKSLGQTEAGVKKSGGGIKSTLAGLGVGAALFGAAKAFDESRKVAAQSEAVIKSTGGAANVTADQMGELANAISKKTGIDDEAIQSGENLIATFTGIRNEAGKGNDIFDQTTRAAVDMATALGQDVTSASQMLGKALNDPLAGLSKLTRAGVVFTQQQKDQIKAMSESGDKLGAQKIILAEVNKEFGGSAEAQATSMGKAKVAIDNLAESLGQVMAPALGVAADAASGLADGLGALPPAVQSTVVVGAAGIAAWLKWGDALSGIGTKAKVAGTKVIGFAQNTKGLKGAALAGAGALGVLGIAFEGWQHLQEVNAKETAGWKASLGEMTDAVVDLGQSTEKAFSQGRLKDQFLKFEDDFDKAGISLKELSAGVTGSQKDFDAFRQKVLEANGYMPGLDKILKDSRENYLDLGESAKSLAKANEAVGLSSAKGSISLKDLGKETVITTGSQADAAQVSKWQAEQLGAIATNAKKATDQISAYFDEITGHLDKQVAVEDAFDALTASLLTNGDTIDINTQKGRDNVKATEAFKQAAVEAAIAERDRTGSSAAGIQSLQDSANRYAEVARKAGLSKNEINLMLASMGLTPKQIDTIFITNATETEKRVLSLRKELETIIGLTHATGMDRVAPGLVNAEIQGRAVGGPVSARTPYLVGERGPELFSPNGAGHITPAAQTRALLSGASGGSSSAAMAGGNTYVTLQVMGSVVTEKDLIASVRNGLIKQGRLRPGQNTLMQQSGVATL